MIKIFHFSGIYSKKKKLLRQLEACYATMKERPSNASQETAGSRIQSVQWNQMPLLFLLEIAEELTIKPTLISGTSSLCIS
jgi:hypothetical protein